MLKNKRLIVLISLVTVIFFLFSSLTGCDIKHTVITTDSASQTEQTETKQSEDTEPEESTTQASSSTEELQDNAITDSENDIMFLNYDINSAFVYPQSGLTITSNPDIRKDFGDMLLSVEISKIEDLEGTLGYDRDTAEKDKKGLEEDNFGEDIDFVFEPSKKVVKIGDVNVKDFIVFARFDVCSVVFERKAIFYNNDYQVIITLHGDKDLIMNSMSEYFKIDEQNCDTNLVWNLDKQQDFYDAIASGKAAAPAQTWYNTFNSILEFLQINDFKGASAGYSRLLDKRIYEKNDELSYIISIAYPEFQSAVSSNLSDTINNSILNETVIPTKNDFIKSVQESGTTDNE